MDEKTEARLKAEGHFWCPHFYWTPVLNKAMTAIVGGYYRTPGEIGKVQWEYCPICGKRKPDVAL